jgi:antitoxin (DNA-binding transcriptional repressor) of toxin-antitoxin stability system
MVAPWRDDVPYVRDGEPVTAAVDGRPLRALAGRSEYLKDRIDAAELGEAVVRRAVSLDPAAAPRTRRWATSSSWAGPSST